MNAPLLAQRKKRAAFMIRWLRKEFPRAGMILRYSNNWELLVAVQLSAQCTDAMVNRVTADLFKKYRTLDDYLRADKKEFERDIFRTGFYKNKTKNILAAARVVRDRFGGRIPRTMEEMLEIPGVGRKTANVVLGNAHRIYPGIAVDTHVRRLSRKFKLSSRQTPEQIEQDLLLIVPRAAWFDFTYLLIDYGRKYSPARRKDYGDPLSVELLRRGLL